MNERTIDEVFDPAFDGSDGRFRYPYPALRDPCPELRAMISADLVPRLRDSFETLFGAMPDDLANHLTPLLEGAARTASIEIALAIEAMARQPDSPFGNT